MEEGILGGGGETVGRSPSCFEHVELRVLLGHSGGGDQMVGGDLGLELMRGGGWAESVGRPECGRGRTHWRAKLAQGR